LHKFAITSEAPQVALEVLGKQILFLINMEVHYSVLPAFVGKPFSQTVIVIGFDGKKQIKNFTFPFLCCIESQFFYA
jgi:hypothetical protein